MTEYKQMTYKIKDCEFNDSYYENTEDILNVELHIDNISELTFRLSDVPNKSYFQIWLENKVKSQEISSIDYNFLSIEFLENRPTVIISLFKYFSDSYEYWDLKWDLKKFFDLVKANIYLFKDIKLLRDNTSETSIDFNIAVIGYDKLTIQEQYLKGLDTIDKIYRIVKLEIGGLGWKNIYLTNEKVFSQDVIEPLLRKMDFDSVKYNHGTKEYGKDFLCSYTDNFKVKRYVAIQVKSGNISGKVNSQIEELLGQIDDAFSMPFKEIGEKSDKYITTFFIIISGYFTDNAKDKIIEKTPKNLIGNITFIDKNGVLDMIENIKNE